MNNSKGITQRNILSFNNAMNSIVNWQDGRCIVNLYCVEVIKNAKNYPRCTRPGNVGGRYHPEVDKLSLGFLKSNITDDKRTGSGNFGLHSPH